MQHLTILTGASRGMGLAIAQQLLGPDARILCISRKTNAELADQALRAGALLEQWPHDLSDAAPLAQALQQWLAAIDPASLASATLINNAASISAVVPLRDADAQELERTLRVGLEAPLVLSAAFLGATRGWQVPRKLLNISSGLGRRPMASSAPYCAVKAGMDHFSRCLALEEALVPNGARICSLAPGVIDTDMQQQLRNADPQAFPDRALFTQLQAQAQLASPAQAAQKIMAHLQRPDFGSEVIADVRA